MIELKILLILAVFSIVCYWNARYIIAFHRACQYDTYGNSSINFTDDGPDLIKEGDIIEDTKMIFWRIRYWAEENLTAFWRKPIYDCPTCMASLHGIIPFFTTAYILNLFSLQGALLLMGGWIFYTLSLSGLATYFNDNG